MKSATSLVRHLAGESHRQQSGSRVQGRLLRKASEARAGLGRFHREWPEVKRGQFGSMTAEAVVPIMLISLQPGSADTVDRERCFIAAYSVPLAASGTPQMACEL